MPHAGLQTSQAHRLLRQWGPNSLTPTGAPTALQTMGRLALTQVRSPLVGILAVGAALALATGSGTDAALVLLILLATGALGVWQEWRAEDAVRELAMQLAPTARVWRDGALLTVPAADIVPGDWLELRAGDMIPADAELIESVSLTVVEASLTGESMPVEKSAPSQASLWAGTSVRSGTGTARVTDTGLHTRLAAIARPLVKPRRPTPFMQVVGEFGTLLMRLLLLIVVLTRVGQAVQGRPLLEGLMLAMALAVGLSPELLPVVVSVTLSQGAWRLSQRGVLLRRLDALEDLGSLDVLCTDKTGTLTQGRMRLVQALDAQGLESPAVLRLGVLNAALETGMANPLDEALVREGSRLGWIGPHAPPLPRKLGEIPYDFLRRRLTVALEPGQLITKGAVREVLACCTGPGRDEARHEAAWARFEALSRQGLRVLAVATRDVAPGTPLTRALEQALHFEGFLVFEDPPRDDARQALDELAARGVQLKIITGDNRHVAQAVARAVGLPDEPLLTGPQIAGLRDEALWHHAQTGCVFAEIDPQQKQLLVRALQRRGAVVGFLGDGINDAPALEAADVGLSVQGAADVARHSADLVFTQPDLAQIARAVDEGRRSFLNTRKYVVVTASANFGNMLSMAAGGWLLPHSPMTAHQILLNNLLSDLPALAIAQDRVDRESMSRPRHWDAADLRRSLWVFGLGSTVFDLLLFALLGRGLHLAPAAFQAAWFLASLATEVVALLVLRTAGPCWRSPPAVPMLAACALALLLGLGAVLWPPAAHRLGFEWPPAAAWGCIGLTVLGYAVATEVLKRRLQQRGLRKRGLQRRKPQR